MFRKSAYRSDPKNICGLFSFLIFIEEMGQAFTHQINKIIFLNVFN